MNRNQELQDGDILIGAKLPERMRRTLPKIAEGLDGVDLHLARLRSLHPTLEGKFQIDELRDMSTEAKKHLLEEIERGMNSDEPTSVLPSLRDQFACIGE